MTQYAIKAGRWCWELPFPVKVLALNIAAYVATLAVILNWYVV